MDKLERQNSNDEILELNRLLLRHSSQLLVAVEFHGTTGDYLLGQTKQIVPHVYRVELASNVPANNFQFDQIFPSMSSLSVDVNIFASAKIVRAYKNLKSLSISGSQVPENTTSFERLIELNPQIKVLKISYSPRNALLRSISEKLNELWLFWMPCDSANPGEHDAPVHFANVDILYIDATNKCPATLPLTFDRLDNVQFSDVDGMADTECSNCRRSARAKKELRPLFRPNGKRASRTATFSMAHQLRSAANESCFGGRSCFRRRSGKLPRYG